jgi:hypothetical protein
MNTVSKMIEEDNARNAARRDKPSPVYRSPTPHGDEPLTWFDKLPPSIQEIIEAEERAKDTAWSDGTAHFQRLDDFGVKIAEAVLAEADILRHPNPNAAMLEKAAKRVAAAKKRKADYEAARKAEQALKPGDRYDIAVEGVQEKQRRGKHTEVFGITDKLADGQSLAERTAELTADCFAKQAEHADVVKQPRPDYEIADAIAEGVERAGTDLADRVRRVRRGDWIGDRNGGSFQPRAFEFATKSIPNGLGGLSTVLDAGALFVLFESEIKAKLTAIALEGLDPAKTIPMGERIKRLAEIDAEILMIRRKHEYWVRQARLTGENPGPRICGEEIRAILDIK